MRCLLFESQSQKTSKIYVYLSFSTKNRYIVCRLKSNRNNDRHPKAPVSVFEAV